MLFQQLEQSEAGLQPRGVDAVEQIQAVRRRGVHFARRLELHRVVLRAEEAGIGAGVDHAVVADRLGNRDAGRHGRGGLKYDTTAPVLGKSLRLRWLRGTASVLLILPVSV